MLLPLLATLTLPLLVSMQEVAPSPDQEIRSALSDASANNKRVLLKLESKWCADCIALEEVQQNRKVWKLLDYEYSVVRIELGKMDQNIALALRWAPDLETVGTPYLVVLDSNGKKLDAIGGSALYGKKSSPSSQILASFLQKNQAKPKVALKVLEAARLEAVRTQRKLFVHLGAPW